MDHGQALFVKGNPGRSGNESAHGSLHGHAGANAHFLDQNRINFYRSRRSCGVVVVRVDGNIVHAHIIFGRNGRGNGRVHGIAVKKWFAFVFRFRRPSGNNDGRHDKQRHKNRKKKKSQ